MAYSTDHISYLSRSFLDAHKGVLRERLSDGDVRSLDPTSLRLSRITQVGRSWSRDSRLSHTDDVRYRSEDLLAGCFGAKIPVLFAVSADPNGLAVHVGTFPPLFDAGRDGSVDSAARAILSLLDASYPGSTFESVDPIGFAAQIERHIAAGRVGVVTGMPSRKKADEDDQPTQLDRLIRAMSGRAWGCVVLAEPLPGDLIHDIQHSLQREMLAVHDAEHPKPQLGPLADAYVQRLKTVWKDLEVGISSGMWTVSVSYYADTAESFDSLGSLLCSCFGGEKSIPDPIRCTALADRRALRNGLGQILLATVESPGGFEYPHSYQTLLNSARLSTLVHIPRHEHPGLTVRDSRRFDVAPHGQAAAEGVRLGAILDRGRPLPHEYLLTFEALNKHALIAGVTGSGKTNTSFNLLRQLWSKGVPFLILEPAKTEYRALAADPLVGPDLRVFTLGQETVSPFRLNPFEVEEGASISTHIDLIKATFNASFAMWAPLPQVLERCLHEIYEDRGWDPVRGTNSRLSVEKSTDPAANSAAFPTLTDLAAKAEEVVEQLGYEERVTSDIRAALVTRLQSLRIGGKGAMLDTPRSIPTGDLLACPTVIELEQVGDDDEKAFLMGLLLTRIYEHLRGHGTQEGRDLRHVVVVEEAHRLLANVPSVTSEEHANTRGKAVESFVNMLSEVRAYGQGFLIAEQIPSKLAPDVMKNTNVKVAHRTVAGDDRQALGWVMNMEQQHTSVLATLQPGEAAVFSEGDDRPLIVRVPYAKLMLPEEALTQRGSDRWIGEAMREFREDPRVASLFLPFPDCARFCPRAYAFCEDASSLAATRAFKESFASLVLGAAEGEAAILAGLDRLRAHLDAEAPHTLSMDEAMHCILLHAVRWYFSYFGRRYEWTYRTMKSLSDDLLEVLHVAVARGLDGLRDQAELLRRFQAAYREACLRTRDPFPACSDVCPSGECRFRYHNEMILGDRMLAEMFDLAMSEAAGRETWVDLEVLDEAAARLGGFDATEESSRSLSLCFGLQQIAYKPGLLTLARELAMERLVTGFDSRDIVEPHDLGWGNPDRPLDASGETAP